jgi:hypothetical protein
LGFVLNKTNIPSFEWKEVDDEYEQMRTFPSVPTITTSAKLVDFDVDSDGTLNVIPFSKLQENNKVDSVIQENQLLKSRITEMEERIDSQDQQSKKMHKELIATKRSEKNLRTEVEELKQKQIQTEGSIRFMIEMAVKLEEKYKFAIRQISEQQEIIKWGIIDKYKEESDVENNE